MNNTLNGEQKIISQFDIYSINNKSVIYIYRVLTRGLSLITLIYLTLCCRLLKRDGWKKILMIIFSV